MEDEKITNFMKEIKSYFEPISNLINFQGIEDFLYAETIGDIDDNDLTMDYIFTLTDFMLDSQQKTKEETIKFYDTIINYEESALEEIELMRQKIAERKSELKKGE